MSGGLLGVVLRGIRSRLLLSAGTVLLIALATGSALLGPIFAEAVTKSYVVTRLNDAPPRSTGLSRELLPGSKFEGGPQAGVRTATAAVLASDRGPFAAPQTQLETTRADSALLDFAEERGMAMLLAKQGACEHLDITGRCPSGPGQALVLAGDLDSSGLAIGDAVELSDGLPDVTIVGSYRVPPTEAPYWYDVSRLASVPRQVLPGVGVRPYQPGPLIVDEQTFDGVPAGAWRVRIDRRLVLPPDWTDEMLAEATASGQTVAGGPVELEAAQLQGSELGDLPALLAEARVQKSTARASVSPAVLSLVLVALALLLRLLTAAGELRLPELALASLRGLTERRIWALGLLEPLALLLIALPLGVAGGVGLAWGLVRWWLAPGLPLPLPVAALVGALVVGVATVAVAVAAVGMVLREPLTSQLAGVRRPGRSRRTALITELAFVAAALALLVSKLTGGRLADPDLLDLVLPIVLAVAAGLLATRAIALVAHRLSGQSSRPSSRQRPSQRPSRWPSRWPSRRPSRGLAGFVAVRALGRRNQGTLVILPLTAAVAVGVFSFGVYGSAAQWRSSVAATQAPAAELWSTSATMGQTFELTRELDPAGASLMALGQLRNPDVPMIVVDAPRLASVLSWSAPWTPGTSKADVQALVEPGSVPPRFTGRRVGLTASSSVDSDRELSVELQVGDAGGKVRSVYLGPYPSGESTQNERVRFCRNGCSVLGLTLAGPAALPNTMTGEFAISSLTVDGAPLPGALADGDWTLTSDDTIRPDQTDDSSIEVRDGRLVVQANTGRAPGQVSMAPGGIPSSRPIVVGVGAAASLEGPADATFLTVSNLKLPVTDVLDAESLPFVGPTGVLIDYRMLTTGRALYEGGFTVHVAVAAATPDALRSQLIDRGLTLETTFAAQKRVLDQGAYALALRLYAIVAVLVLLMAFAGLIVSTAVQLPTRRRDAAALRVVGVPRRTVVSAVAQEFAVVLGGAALVGIAAGALAQYVVLRTIRIGYVEDLVTPRLVARVDLPQLALLALAAAVCFGAFAVISGALTVRGARGSSLRETAQ